LDQKVKKMALRSTRGGHFWKFNQWLDIGGGFEHAETKTENFTLERAMTVG